MSVAANEESNAEGIGSKEYKRIVEHFIAYPIKKTKELLVFATINPYKESKLIKSWQKIGKCNDYIRKYSRCYFIVQGTNQDKTKHYHVLCYLPIEAVYKIKNSKQFNIDVKEFTTATTNDFVGAQPDDEYNDANDVLAALKKPYSTTDIYIQIGYERCRRDLMLSKKKVDPYAMHDFSNYMFANLFKNVESPDGWIEYHNFIKFPRN